MSRAGNFTHHEGVSKLPILFYLFIMVPFKIKSSVYFIMKNEEILVEFGST